MIETLQLAAAFAVGYCLGNVLARLILGDPRC